MSEKVQKQLQKKSKYERFYFNLQKLPKSF